MMRAPPPPPPTCMLLRATSFLVFAFSPDFDRATSLPECPLPLVHRRPFVACRSPLRCQPATPITATTLLMAVIFFYAVCRFHAALPRAPPISRFVAGSCCTTCGGGVLENETQNIDTAIKHYWKQISLARRRWFGCACIYVLYVQCVRYVYIHGFIHVRVYVAVRQTCPLGRSIISTQQDRRRTAAHSYSRP